MLGRHGFTPPYGSILLADDPCLFVNRSDMEKEPVPFRSGAGSFFPIVRFDIRYAIIFALNAISRAASLAVRPAGSS